MLFDRSCFRDRNSLHLDLYDMCEPLTFSFHEVCEEVIPLSVGQTWAFVHEVIERDKCVLGVPPHHQGLKYAR